MPSISLRLNDEDSKLLHEYVSMNGLNLSQFIRETILDKIEEDFNLDEKRILAALEKSKKEKSYSHDQVWSMLDL